MVYIKNDYPQSYHQNYSTKKADDIRQPSCICKIVRRSRARQRITADFVCKGTQFLVNPRYVLRAYFLKTSFILQHLALAHSADASQGAG